MGKPGNKIRIPIPEDEFLSLALKVKPTADMPRPRASPSKPKKVARRKVRQSK
jgi:hypothetical protein